MLYDIRERFIGTTGKIVLAVILLLLAFTGFNYTITPKSYVAKVGGEEISLRRVQNAYRAQLERFGDQELPPVLLNQLQAIAVEQVITETALLQYLDEQGFAISDQQIADSITGLEVFQTDGQFDQELYRRLLAQNVMTPATFERDQRAQLMLSQFQATIATSSFFTPAEFRRLIELSNEQREVEWATVSADAFIDDVVINEAEVASFYESNPTRFQTEASANIEYLMIDDALARERATPDEQELRAYFDSVSDQFVGAEQRRASHVLLRTDEDGAAARELAESLLVRIQVGEPFEDIARTYSDDGGSARQGGDLGWVARGDFVGPVEDAVFGMTKGQISDIVESSFGLHIIRLDDVRSGDAPTFEQVADDVREQYIAEREATVLLTLQQQLGDEFFSATTLEEIASAMSLEILNAEGFTADSAVPFGSSEALTDAVFGADARDIGELIDIMELDDSRSVILRVTDRTPAGRQPLAEVTDTIRDELLREAAGKIAAERGAQLAGVLSSDPTMSFETLVLNSAATLQEKKLVARRDPTTPAPLASALFAAKMPVADEPVIGNVSVPGESFIIYRLTDIVPGDAGDIPPQQLDAARSQLARRNGDAQLQALLAQIREQTPVEMGAELQSAAETGF